MHVLKVMHNKNKWVIAREGIKLETQQNLEIVQTRLGSEGSLKNVLPDLKGEGISKPVYQILG